MPFSVNLKSPRVSCSLILKDFLDVFANLDIRSMAKNATSNKAQSVESSVKVKSRDS